MAEEDGGEEDREVAALVRVVVTSQSWACRTRVCCPQSIYCLCHLSTENSPDKIVLFCILGLVLLSRFNMSWIFGHATTTWAHPATPLQLTTKSGDEVSLPDFCKDTIPACDLNPLLFNGHLQTCYTAVKEEAPPIIYKRKIFKSDHVNYPGQFTADFVVRSLSPKDETLPERTSYFSEKELEQIEALDSKPMLIALHGLSGGSHEVYLRHALGPLLTTEAGWEACVINARGCAMSKITSDKLFNARATWDVRQLVKWLREKFPNRNLYGIGFSLGANILTNVRAFHLIIFHFV
jgi:hypothetical protein